MAITRGDQQVAPIHSPSLLARDQYGYKAAFQFHLLIKLKKQLDFDKKLNLMLARPSLSRLIYPHDTY